MYVFLNIFFQNVFVLSLVLNGVKWYFLFVSLLLVYNQDMNSRSTGQTAHIYRMCDTSADHLLFLTILLTHLMDHVIFYNPTLSREEIQHFLGARCPINTLNTAFSSLTLNV